MVEFIRRQVDQDQLAAAAAAPHLVGLDLAAELIADRYDQAVAEYLARQHPLRGLSEVDAKRKILTRIEGDHSNTAQYLLGVLGTVYADRPGYRSEWALGTRTDTL
jgi:hypothetical protein